LGQFFPEFPMHGQKQQRSPSVKKVQPISSEADTRELGLPVSLDAERFVLGALLLDDTRFGEISELDVEDFSFERHQTVFRRMWDLHTRGEHIDRVTVAEELRCHNELGPDGVSFLLSLDEGIPQVPHLESYVRILRKKSALRRGAVLAQKLMNECLVEGADPAELFANHRAHVEELAAAAPGRTTIRRVEDLDSIFAKRMPTEYLINPELPMKAVVCLTGDSESGKTTLACAWARDLYRIGHAFLILDRDKNPRDRICDRLERLGIESDGERFGVWDCEQSEEAPLPDDPIILDWVKRMVAVTGKAPLVIVDSLISFFKEDEDENSAADMRRLFNRCRALTRLGATVILIHHTNRNGEARGSSDFGPAGDQEFLVKNTDRNGGRLLDVITLTYQKSRYGRSGKIEYRYAGGKMLRVENGTESTPFGERLEALLRANPGVLSEAFEKLASEVVPRAKAREFLKKGQEEGAISIEVEGRNKRHYWRGPQGD
jgi:hypothetical protein